MAVFAVIALGIGINSCQKDKMLHDNIDEQSEQVLKDVQIEKQILQFKNKIAAIRENPGLKSGNDPLSIDSAIWYIEAASNYTYGNAASDLEEMKIESSFIEVPLSNGLIIWTDVQLAFDKVIDSLSAQNAKITAIEKQLIATDISLTENTGNSAVFEINSGFGINGNSVSGNDHYWYWGWEQGTCDGSGYGVGWDAANRIAQLANYQVPVRSGYYIDVTDREIWYWDVPTDNNPYGEYLLFHDSQIGTLIHKCLSPAEISYYKSALGVIANMYKPSGKYVIRYFAHDETSFGICEGQDCWDMCHVTRIKYGTWHAGGGGSTF